MDFSDLPKSASTFECVDVYQTVKNYWNTECKPCILKWSTDLKYCSVKILNQLDDCFFPKPYLSTSAMRSCGRPPYDLPKPCLNNRPVNPTPNVQLVYQRPVYTPPVPVIPTPRITRTLSESNLNLIDTCPSLPRWRESGVCLDGGREHQVTLSVSDTDSEGDWEKIEGIL